MGLNEFSNIDRTRFQHELQSPGAWVTHTPPRVPIQEIRLPISAPIALQENIAFDPSQVPVFDVCIGARTKFLQRMQATEQFLKTAIMFAGADSIDVVLQRFGEHLYSKNHLLGHRLWDHDDRTGIYTVDFLSWKYAWTHGSSCPNQQDHR